MSIMIAPETQTVEGRWPQRRTTILDWLVTQTRAERFLDNILVEFCIRLRQVGVPVGRMSLHLRTDHPQWLGARILWRTGMKEAEIHRTEYDVITTDQFHISPVRAIIEGYGPIRERISAMPDGPDAYPIIADLRQQGYTDYTIWGLDYTLDKRHVISFAADAPGGFSDPDIALLADLLPALALVTEIRLKNRLARTFLETYVGPHASEMILNGSTRRGSGVTLGAAILVCDLRGFTEISELWPRDDVIALLNDYFDAMSTPIERHGGEILKFIGDGMLAVFRLSDPEACNNLLKAVAEARTAMQALNDRRMAEGWEPLGYGVGIHVGDVMYGNIGSRSRLDFTVIGPAVNIAARLESLTKEVGRGILFSAAFVARSECARMLEPIGRFPLRGVGEPIEVFAMPETGSCHEETGPGLALDVPASGAQTE